MESSYRRIGHISFIGALTLFRWKPWWSSLRKTEQRLRWGRALWISWITKKWANRWLFHLHIRSALTAVSFFFFNVSWNHFLRVTLTYVPINKLATLSQLTCLAETRSSCASVWVNSHAHSTGKDQVYQCVLISLGSKKLFFFLIFMEIHFDFSI